MIIPFTRPSKKSVTIDTLYNYSKSQNVTLLPTEDYDFWAAYEVNYAKFDRYFYQKFRAFKVMQDYGSDVSLDYMLTDWKQLVDAHLFVNAKRYSELYRVQVLADTAYDIANNYDLHETITRAGTGSISDHLGNRTDSHITGAQEHETRFGATSNETRYGARTDSNQTTLGAQTSGTTESRSAFNSTTMQDTNAASISNGARQDSASLTEGAHTDVTEAATHTDVLTDGARTDSATTGAQQNLRETEDEETTTVRRYGNIGVQTPADVIGGHIDLWEAFKFYQMIFDEIADVYLVIDVDFDFETVNASGGSGGGGDAELLAAIRALSAQLTAAQTSINDNVDSAETNIRSDISTLSSKNTTEANRVIASVSFQGGALSTKTTTEANRVIAAVTMQGGALHTDIVGVTTNGY